MIICVVLVLASNGLRPVVALSWSSGEVYLTPILPSWCISAYVLKSSLF